MVDDRSAGYRIAYHRTVWLVILLMIALGGRQPRSISQDLVGSTPEALSEQLKDDTPVDYVVIDLSIERPVIDLLPNFWRFHAFHLN